MPDQNSQQPDQLAAMRTVANAVFAYELGRLEKLKTDSTIAHYTTADTALQIIKNRSFWLRNAGLMNDFSEIEHGDACLTSAFGDPFVRHRMLEVLDAHYPGLTDELISGWERQRVQAKRLTYIGSFAEIPNDDVLGRLSMWRAYGGRAGVALCLNTKILDAQTAELGVFHSPVLYGSDAVMRAQVLVLLDRLAAIQPDLKNAGRDAVTQYLSNLIRFAVLSFKHPGFEEEREWRMIYNLDQRFSPHLEHEAVSVNGVPQVVCQVPLSNKDGLNMPELGIENVFDRIIIGPCDSPDQVRMALYKALNDQGVPQPRIDISNIPLRQG